MIEIAKSIVSPILSLIFLTLGNGFFTTYITVRLQAEGYEAGTIGYITAFYYAGLLLGSFRAEKAISQIGHIRSFSVFASSTAVLILLQAFWINPISWAFLRFGAGICMAGLFVTVESWLLYKGTTKTRGKVLSIYMCSFYAAQGIGQYFLDLADPMTMIPFTIAALFSAISILPVSLTKSAAPIISEPSCLTLKKLIRISPLGMLGSLIGGMILSAVYGLIPIYANSLGLNVSEIATLMSMVIFGGLLLQWPIGQVSDHIDRRKVILFTCFVSILLSLSIALFGGIHHLLLLGLMGLFGGFASAVYPLSVSHTCDQVKKDDVVSATSGLLLTYGSGAVIGPLLAPIAMYLLGPSGLFIYFMVILGALLLFCTLRLSFQTPTPEEEKLTHTNIPRTSPIASEMDPRIEEKAEKDSEEKKLTFYSRKNASSLDNWNKKQP